MTNGVEQADRGPRPLRVSVIAVRDAFNSHVLSALARVCTVDHVFTVVESRRSRLRRLRLLEPSPRAGVRIARSIVLTEIDRRDDRRTRSSLAGTTFWPDRSSVISQAELLDGRGKEIFSRLGSDLLLLSGAPLLPQDLFSIPRLGTVNLHCGLSHRYRGNHGLLFPLVRREYDAIGSTLHYVDAGIDTGTLIARGRPSIDSSDTLAGVWAKTARTSATMLTEFIEALGRGPVPGVASAERGVLIRDRDRRVRQYLRLGVHRRLAVLRPVRSTGDVERYF